MNMEKARDSEKRETSAIESLRSELWGDEKTENELQYAVVLDPLSWPGLQQRLEDEGSVEYYIAYSGLIDQEYIAVMPRCARLSSPFIAWIAPRVFRYGAVFFSWVMSHGKDLMDLTAMLARANRVWLPDGRSAWFRWYDPMILSDFLPIADEGQRASFFGDWIDGIRIFHPLKKEWERFSNRRRIGAAPALRIDAEQMERMGEKSFDRLIRRLSEQLQTEQPQLTPGMLEEHVRHSVALAEDHGIFNENDLISFVCLDAKANWALRWDKVALSLLHTPHACMMENMAELESYINKHYKRA